MSSSLSAGAPSSVSRVTPAVNPDLQCERDRCSFPQDAMTNFIYGSEYVQSLARIKKLLSHNPKLELTDLWHVNKYDRYLRACERAEEVVRLARTHQLSQDDLHMIEVMIGEDFFLHLHLTMFLPTLSSMADDEQQAKWLPLAKDFRIFGTYAQTELGHGSNVMGLETTATFDAETDEWVLLTPTLTATKWWPGGLAKSCTHCILMAQLIINDKNYGPHPFFLQIRDLNNHETLPGIFLADIGQKMGYNGMDNGCMQLRNVRIPRRNLLMRYASVSREGVYAKQGNPKMMYGAMTFTRKQIIAGAGASLAKAVTIATRYSAVRRQFSMLSPKELAKLHEKQEPIVEAPVLDYSTQLYTLVPLIAASFAFSSAGHFSSALYEKMMSKARSGDFSLLGETHIVTSCLKAFMTGYTLEGIEQCRKACGGHGYLHSSGLPDHYTKYAPQPTYEGDFVVLSIQVGRAMLKEVSVIMAGGDQQQQGTKKKGAVSAYPAESSMSYLREMRPDQGLEYLLQKDGASLDQVGLEWFLEAFKRRAAVLVYKCARSFMEARGQGRSALEVMDDVKIDFTRITIAHAQVLIYGAFIERIAETVKREKRLGKVLSDLARIYALNHIDKYAVEFVNAKVFRAEVHDEVLALVKQLLKELRGEAVGLVDSWNFPDFLLNSTLGKYDGYAYEALYDSIKYDANNKSDVHEGYFRHLQYILHPERKVQGTYAALNCPRL